MRSHQIHRITGTSMDRLGLEDGMLVRVRITDAAYSGQVVAVLEEDDGVIVKRVWWDPWGAWLVPESFDPGHAARRAREGERILGVLDQLPERPWRHLTEPPFVLRGADLMALYEAYEAERRVPRSPSRERSRQPWASRPLRMFPLPLDGCSSLDFLRAVPIEQDDMAGRGLVRGHEAGIAPMHRDWWFDRVVVYVDLGRYGLGRRFMELVGDGHHLWAKACPLAPGERAPGYAVDRSDVLGYVRNSRPAGACIAASALAFASRMGSSDMRA